MLKKLKSNKGITGVDATIAIVILMIFVPLMASLISNMTYISLRNTRKTVATNLAVQIMEGIKSMNYDEIKDGLTAETVLAQNAGNFSSIPNGYTVNKINIVERDSGKDINVSVEYVSNEKSAVNDNDKETIELNTTIYKDSTSNDLTKLSTNITNAKSSYEENDVINYEITVTNVGGSTLSNVYVVLEKLQNQYGETESGQTWKISDTLAAGDVGKVTKEISAKNGMWTAYFKITAQTADGQNLEYTKQAFVYSVVVKTKMLVKVEVTNTSADANGFNLNEEVKYKVSITNTGINTLKGISLQTIDGTDENVIGRLEPGETQTLEDYTYTIKESDIGKGTGTYSVTATVTEPVLAQTAYATFKILNNISEIGIAFQETSSPASGDTYNYTNDTGIDFNFTITNSGNTALKNVDIRLYIGSATDLSTYDYSYGWTNDIGINKTLTIDKKVLTTAIRKENFTGNKIAYIIVTKEDGTEARSPNINLKFSNT